MNSTLENLIQPDGLMDVRALPCSVKHGLILRACLDLPVGGYIILQNGHNPQRLLDQLSLEWPEAFAFETQVNKPEECRVKISKLKKTEEKAALPSPPACSH